MIDVLFFTKSVLLVFKGMLALITNKGNNKSVVGFGMIFAGVSTYIIYFLL